MRSIGHLQGEALARAFGDFLYTQGIDTQVEAEGDGRWLIWVVAEEHVDRASGLLQEFRADPSHPRYTQASKEARERRHHEQQAVEAAQRRFFDSTRLFPDATRPPLGPFTLGLIALCVIVFLIQMSELGERVKAALMMSNYIRPMLPEIRQGEVWRLFTPILMHIDFLHLLFNMLWIKDLGSLIERRQGAPILVGLVLGFALFSNLGQFTVAGPSFLGMSGVVYGLFGYIWVRGRVDPSSGLFLDQNTVMLMMIWFFVCFTGWVGPIANMAHAGGLASGAAWGYLSGRFGRLRFRK